LAQYQKVQGSEPNLPHNEANHNMSEAGIFVNSDTQKIADTASMEHARQIGVGVGKQQCPIINDIEILSLFFDKFSKYLVTVN
jgi:hypothetical protein